jgi:hypothetical protein
MIKKISLVLFLICLPLSLKITFPQNDDWVYYGMVENFLNGNFVLDPISAPTFYVQGLMGLAFAAIFTINRLPVLTLLVSILGFNVFYMILLRITNHKAISLVLSLLFFFNPLFVYSMWGFMTENYFLLFVLLSIYFYTVYEDNKSRKSLLVLYFMVSLAFMVKQAALFLPLGFSLYSLLKKDLRQFFNHLLGFTGLFGLYLSFFPRTKEMFQKSLQFQHFSESDYVYALVYGSLLLLVAFLLPLVITTMFSAAKKAKSKSTIVLGILIVITYVIFNFLNNKYEPNKVSWGEFPYLENTFERTGFYPRGIGGTKYQFRGIFDLYKYWDLFAKIAISGLLVSLIVVGRKRLNVYGVLIMTCLGLMVVTETFYDRYLLPLVPLLILYLITALGTDLKNISKALYLFVWGFVGFLAFYSYQFSMDFVLSNKYVWEKSTELVQTKNVEPAQVQGTNAWKLVYGGVKSKYVYDFSYDSQNVNAGYKCCYEIIEEKKIEFPLSFFIEPKVYLYKKL